MFRVVGFLFLIVALGCQSRPTSIDETRRYDRMMNDSSSVEYRDRVEQEALLRQSSQSDSRVHVVRPEKRQTQDLGAEAVSDIVSSVLNPKSNEKLYQFHVRLQCEFKRHLHTPIKGVRFQWEIVGFSRGEGVTDLDGQAMVSLKSVSEPTFVDIYYQDKKYRFGAYDNVVVNIQDCEI